jgi:hypothetical protein
MVDFAVDPRKLALVNVDPQNVFVEGFPISSPDGPAVVARVNKLAAVCRKAGVLVVHTAHVTRPDGSNMGVMGEIIPRGPRRHDRQRLLPGRLPQRSEDRGRDAVLDKPRFGVFHGTDLELILRIAGGRQRHHHQNRHQRVRRDHPGRGQRAGLPRLLRWPRPRTRQGVHARAEGIISCLEGDPGCPSSLSR